MTLLVLLLSGCGSELTWEDDPAAPTCDPRVLVAGEVRAKRIGCSRELVDGGEGRTGDWVLENAVARFVVRGTYASLTTIGEPGGTLVDAVAIGEDGAQGTDLLVEWIPDGDRTSVEAVNALGSASLVLPGVTYRLAADSAALELASAGGGVLVAVEGAERTGPTVRGGDAFLGLDGVTQDNGAQPRLSGVTRIAVAPEALWPDGSALSGEADADTVVLSVQGADVSRLPVIAGAFDGWAPAGVVTTGERAGCDYASGALAPRACAGLYVRVTDDALEDLRAVVTDGTAAHRLPRGGGTAPVGTGARPLWVWAGPAYEALSVDWRGVDDSVSAILTRAFDTEGWELLDLTAEVSPDADAARPVDALVSLRAGEGVGFVAALADHDIPSGHVDERDGTLVVAGTRTGGWITSWPWTGTTRRAGHGAPDPAGLGALDQLAVAGGGLSAARRLLVTPEWVDAALVEAPPEEWSPTPDAVILDGPEDASALVRLLDAYVDVVPVGPRTWVQRGSTRNVPGVEAGLVEGPTSAGTGPRLRVTGEWSRLEATWSVRATVDAPAWMGIERVTVVGAGGAILGRAMLSAGQEVRFRVPADEPYVFAVAEGARARPWGEGTAWAVSSPVWLADGP